MTSVCNLQGKDTLEHALLENKYLHCNVKSLEDDICNLVNVNASNEEQWTNEKLSVSCSMLIFVNRNLVGVHFEFFNRYYHGVFSPTNFLSPT